MTSLSTAGKHVVWKRSFLDLEFARLRPSIAENALQRVLKIDNIPRTLSDEETYFQITSWVVLAMSDLKPY
jgi:hypothetical protein